MNDKDCKVTINNELFLANRGELLLDWALMNGVDLPHDCRSGICGACACAWSTARYTAATARATR
jgi:ferredoxin